MLDWAIVVLPVVIALLAFFARVPEAGKRFSLTLRIVVGTLAIIVTVLAWIQHVENARAQQNLVSELAQIRTVTPLRKQSAELAKEMLEFYAERETYNKRFRPGRALSAKETRDVFAWYTETVNLYHSNYERRIISTLNENHSATGMDVTTLQAEAKAVRFSPEIGDVAIKMSAFAASLL
jgi:hypothetical protein